MFHRGRSLALGNDIWPSPSLDLLLSRSRGRCSGWPEAALHSPGDSRRTSPEESVKVVRPSRVWGEMVWQALYKGYKSLEDGAWRKHALPWPPLRHVVDESQQTPHEKCRSLELLPAFHQTSLRAGAASAPKRSSAPRRDWPLAIAPDRAMRGS